MCPTQNTTAPPRNNTLFVITTELGQWELGNYGHRTAGRKGRCPHPAPPKKLQWKKMAPICPTPDMQR